MDLAALKRYLDERRTRHPRRWRAAAFVVIALLASALIVRVVLDPIATHYTRRGLDQLDGYSGALERVHVTLFPPGYTITRLKLWEDPGGSPEAPLFYADRVHLAIGWRELLHLRLAARARVEHAKVILAQRPAEKKKPEREARPPDLSAQLRKITPLEVDRVGILNSEVLFRDLTEPGHPELWLHDLEAAIENIATRPSLAGGRPTTISARGTLGRSGKVDLFVTANPFASPLSFAGRFRLRGLRAAELYDMIAPRTKLQTPEGTIDLFAEFTSRNGEIDGGVKPVLKDISVAPAEPGLVKQVEAWAAEKAVRLFSDRVPERNAVATVVPIKGRLTDPDVQLLPAVLGVIRNAFVEGVASGFAHLPPPTAASPESAVTQTKRALQKSKGPPRAQPEDHDEKGAHP